MDRSNSQAKKRTMCYDPFHDISSPNKIRTTSQLLDYSLTNFKRYPTTFSHGDRGSYSLSRCIMSQDSCLFVSLSLTFLVSSFSLSSSTCNLLPLSLKLRLLPTPCSRTWAIESLSYSPSLCCITHIEDPRRM